MLKSTSETFKDRFAGVPGIRTAKPDYLGTCPLCKDGLGLIDPPPLNPAQTVREGRQAQWNAGELTLCTCQAGQARLRSLTGKHFDQAETIRRQQAEAAARRQQALFDGAGIPPKFLNFTTKGFIDLVGKDPGKQDAIKAVLEYWKFWESGGTPGMGGVIPGLLLFGATDMGKTGLLSPLFMQMVRLGKSGLWVQYNNLMASLKDFDSGKVDERVRKCQTVDFLFLDDFGDPASDRAATDYTRDAMFRIIDARHSNMLPTFVTTNLDLEKLTGQFHERLTRRLVEICLPVHVGGRKMTEILKGGKR